MEMTYSWRWIGRGGIVTWPPYFPDLNNFDFFFWGYLKMFVYQTSVDLFEDLTPRIAVASVDITSTQDVFGCVLQSLLLIRRLWIYLRISHHGPLSVQQTSQAHMFKGVRHSLVRWCRLFNDLRGRNFVFFLTLNYDAFCILNLLYVK